MNNSISDLQRLFDALMLANYGSSKTIKLPFFGGYLELSMEFVDHLPFEGMIRLMSANSVIMGEKNVCRGLNLGYTTPVSIAKDVMASLESLRLEGISASVKLMKTADDDLSIKVAEQIQGV